jgi:hypothetical protein
MSTITTIFIIAILVEAIVEYGKLIFVSKSINWKQVASLAIGVALAVLANIDLLAAVGVTFTVPFVGVVLTGIILSRGPGYVADFLKLIQTAKTQTIPDDILYGDADDDPAESTIQSIEATTVSTDPTTVPAANDKEGGVQ